MTQLQLNEIGFDGLNRFDIDNMRITALDSNNGFRIMLKIFGNHYENEGFGEQYLPQINTIEKLKNLISVLTVCTHENEKMRQGDGFVYVTCKDCGATL